MSGNAQASRAALALLALAGCATACDAPETTPGSSPRNPPPPRAATIESPALDELLERVKAHLAEREQASVGNIITRSAQAVVWRDMSMGCGRPTESYAQIEVEGFRIVLELDGRTYDYHARRDGSFVLCEPASLQTPRGRIPPG